MKTDLYYTTDGFFVTLIPNTEDGEYIWNEIANSFEGAARFPAHMKPSIFAQIKDAGYTVCKAPKVKFDNISDDELLAELGV